MNDQLHIVFAGGGTAGHLLPGLAVAERLSAMRRHARVTFVGTAKELERRLVESAGYEQVAIASRPLLRGARAAMQCLAANVRGYYQALQYLQHNDVSLVVGLGGYASVPAVRAALRLGVPYVLLEQNAAPGRATRWLGSRAEAVCMSLGEARSSLPRKTHARLTGNPVRSAFIDVAAQRRPDAPKRLVVLGGSGGASALNQAVPLAIYRAQASLPAWQIVHQTGPRDEEATKALYAKLGITAQVGAFINNMAQTLAGADLVLSRAGGTTLAELACAGTPAILVPYPHAADQHQLRNAEVFAAAGACRIVDQQAISGRLDHALADEITLIASDALLRQRLAQGMLRKARPAAAQTVADMVLQIVAHRRLATSGC